MDFIVCRLLDLVEINCGCYLFSLVWDCWVGLVACLIVGFWLL